MVVKWIYRVQEFICLYYYWSRLFNFESKFVLILRYIKHFWKKKKQANFDSNLRKQIDLKRCLNMFL